MSKAKEEILIQKLDNIEKETKNKNDNECNKSKVNIL